VANQAETVLVQSDRHVGVEGMSLASETRCVVFRITTDMSMNLKLLLSHLKNLWSMKAQKL